MLMTNRPPGQMSRGAGAEGTVATGTDGKRPGSPRSRSSRDRNALVGTPLHVYGHHGWPYLHLVLHDAVAATPRAAVPGPGQRLLRRHRLLVGRLFRLVGALHARKGIQPPPPGWAWKVLIPVGVVGQVLMTVWFHVWQDDVRDLMGVTHLEWYDYPLAGGPVTAGPVHPGRSRPAHPDAVQFPCGTA